MNWKTTWLLVALAVTLFAFIWLVERHGPSTQAADQPPARLLPIRAGEVHRLQVRWTNQLLLSAERTNRDWRLSAPIAYPAQTFAIQNLLQQLELLTGPPRILGSEIRARRARLADYGLEPPQAALALEAGPVRVELLFGARTVTGDHVYLRLLTSQDVYLAPATLLDQLPRSIHDWRDPAVLPLAGLVWDRFEVRSAGRGFAISVDATNQLFLLAKPTPARADRAKLEALLRRLEAARVAAFLTDNPRAELEPFGLAPPEAELAFGQGTNELLVLQFGKSATNDPTLVYARCLPRSNLFLVAKSLLEALQTPYTELRDRRLLTLGTQSIDRIEIAADEQFVLSRQTNQWIIEPPLSQLADPDAVRECLDQLARLEGEVEKDVVTDFTAYGLAPPARQYRLLSVQTNAAGVLTNRLLAQLDLGPPAEKRVFARGADSNSVFSISRGDYELLPAAAWQMRERRVWSFTTNQVLRASIRQHGVTRELVRQGPAAWRLAPGSQGVINPLAIEEVMFQLGQLRALYWVDHGERNRDRYGFRDDGYQLSLEVQDTPGGPTRMLVLELPAPEAGQPLLALAAFDGQTWFFKMPPRLYFELLRHLSNPPRGPAPAGGR